MNELDNIIILDDENGNEVSFEFLDLVEYRGEVYIVLLPCGDSEECGEVVILKIENVGEEDKESYISVDDPGILNSVFEIFKVKFQNEFDFED